MNQGTEPIMSFKYSSTTGAAATANLLGSFKYSFAFESEMMANKTSTIITLSWTGLECSYALTGVRIKYDR